MWALHSLADTKEYDISDHERANNPAWQALTKTKDRIVYTGKFEKDHTREFILGDDQQLKWYLAECRR